jgi:hypothetical protein
MTNLSALRSHFQAIKKHPEPRSYHWSRVHVFYLIDKFKTFRKVDREGVRSV